MNIARLSAQETWPLRRDVLRPGQSLENVNFAEDIEPTAAHFGLLYTAIHPITSGKNHLIVGVASMYNKPPDIHAPHVMAMPGPARANLLGGQAWQLRGMATAAAARGTGGGGALLQACIAHATERRGLLFWCNARTGVRGFYEKYGLRVSGEPYEVATVGPHVFMWMNLPTP